MEITRHIARYRQLRRQGKTEEARQLKRKMETGARALISGHTRRRRVPALLASFFVRLTQSREAREERDACIRAFAAPDRASDRRWLRRAKKDLSFCEFFYQISADEYFRYRFEALSDEERRQYVGDAELVAAFKKLDDPEESQLLSNKYNSYCRFRPFFRREAMLLNGKADEALFTSFVGRHPVFFVKPLSQFGGHGVRRLSLGADGGPGELFRSLCGEAPLILEEPIVQGAEMAKYHPQSINTIRIVTLLREGKLEIVQSSVRLGTGDSVVDNGCLSAAVDTETGVITSPGRAAHGRGLYAAHPDSGEQIPGSRIPAWQELLEQVREQAAVFQRQRIVGWDMAYSQDGWVMVEANTHPAIQTLAGAGKGMRPLFEHMLS